MIEFVIPPRSPEYIELVVYRPADDTGFDYNDITSVDITVHGPRGVLSWDWTTTIESATVVRLRHAFASDGSDATSPGIYSFTGWLISAASRRRIRKATVEGVRE